jgi:hypothetical protein
VGIDSDLRQVLEICKGDYKAALPMVVVANSFYEEEIARLEAEASFGYVRGKGRKPAPARACEPQEDQQQGQADDSADDGVRAVGRK